MKEGWSEDCFLPWREPFPPKLERWIRLLYRANASVTFHSSLPWEWKKKKSPMLTDKNRISLRDRAVFFESGNKILRQRTWKRSAILRASVPVKLQEQKRLRILCCRKLKALPFFLRGLESKTKAWRGLEGRAQEAQAMESAWSREKRQSSPTV